MIHDDLKLKGRLDIVVTSEDDIVKQKSRSITLWLRLAKTVASRMASTSSSVMSHVIGTNSTAAAVGNTLGSESARVALTSTTVTDNDVVYVATFPANTPSSAAAITEAAIFNASTNGTMLCRTVFSVINKSSSDSLTVTWTVSAS